MVRTADPATQLVQLGQTKIIGAVDDNGIRGRHVDTGFNNGRTQQQVKALMIKIRHHPFQLTFRHLSVRDAHYGFRHQRL